jgi:asparagine synthase (glutamine-hydrolysing)
MLAHVARGLRAAARRLESFESRNTVCTRVIRNRLTYLEPAALLLLEQQVAAIERNRIEGAIVEAGCALGGSSIVICSAKDPARPMYLYDTFAGMPPPSDRDGKDVHTRYAEIQSGKSAGIGGDAYYGYRQDLLGEVRATFTRYGLEAGKHSVVFVPGLYDDTLHPPGPVALAHIDCDWYNSVAVCLDRVVPKVVPGGRLVIDDYFSYTGCRSAVWDYFRHRLDDFTFQYGPRLVIVRNASEPGPPCRS